MSSAQNTIKIMCPNLTCGKVLAVPGAARGKVVRCRHCGTTIKIPAPQAAAGSAENATATDTTEAA